MPHEQEVDETKEPDSDTVAEVEADIALPQRRVWRAQGLGQNNPRSFHKRANGRIRWGEDT